MAAGDLGREWIVDAEGCDPDRLRSLPALRGIFDAVTAELGLRPVAAATWHEFPGPGGVTGLLVLAESHLACHTFPEHGAATFNLYCCRPRDAWPWEERLRKALGAATVTVRVVTRGRP